MDRNMRAAVFSPIRNKSFEDHKQSDELPACNISKYLKGPAAFKENLQKTSADITSKRNKKPSGSGLQNKSLDKASEHKIKDTSKKLLIKRRDIFASSPEFNATVPLASTVEDSNEHPDCSSNPEIVIKNKKYQQKNSKHDQSKETSNKSDKILATNLTKRNDKDLSAINFVTVRNDKRGSQQSETKYNNSENLDNLLSYPDKNNKSNPQTIIPSSRSSKDLDKRISKDDKNNQLLDTDCSSQLQTVKKQTAVIVSESKNKKGSKEISSSRQHQPSQIQSTMIEKLINNAVSYQFDGIRQQLYLQHASLCRNMNLRLEEIEEQHAASNESLLKIIQELSEENRVLRNAILAHQ
ncbi:hypothetical protein TNIN_288011 [Trichonephila inaurata madagascariensis]|uniref:Uncharacterized protein n=1 Tax=Trichonephila inaurata madagascariensis TaxID=2747483 RepID=A0A8X6YEK3_9ARAC|nr:hypothetical protein TNIN_288011 [Trichonephila inaurata madagascariensis]